MPWFKIDDKAHSHPKFIKAGNAALGLWLRCGSYAAQHLTEGVVPGVVVEMYGTKPQAAKLVKSGLWHGSDHDCDRCVQPRPGDYVMHDYLEDGRNTSRARYEADKKKARDRKAKQREDGGTEGSGQKSSPKADRFEDESSSKNSEMVLENLQSSGSTAGQGHLSHRDKNGTGIHAAAAPVPGTSYGSTAAATRARADRLPDPLADLKRGIAAAGLSGIAWDLRESHWEYTRQAIARVGVPDMVAYAVNSARLKGPPAGASAWVQGWRSLEPAAPPQRASPDLPVAAGQNVVPFQPASRPSTSDLRAQAAIDAGRRLQALADEQEPT